MRDKKQKRILEKTLFYYPFTPAGTGLFLVCLWILINGIATQNPYNIFISTMGLIIMTLLATLGRIRATFIRAQHVKWDSGAPLYAEIDNQFHRIIFENIKAPLFYRLHFVIMGKMTVGNGASCYIFKEGSSSGEEPLKISLNFTFCGIAHVKGFSSLRDIFGLTRARFGPSIPRTLIIQPAPLRAYENSFIRALGGHEEKTTRKSTEEERYYMREYIPGDRFRDINWKSSSRLSQLITRISPHSQEKTKLINVEFRHFWSRDRESRDSIAHLNLIKSALLFFLKKTKSENPGFTFAINTSRGGYFLETEEDVENFSLELSTIFFEREVATSIPYHTNAPPAVRLPGALTNPPAGSRSSGALLEGQAGSRSELYVFSTPYDLNLPGWLTAYRDSSVYLFITRQEVVKSSFIHKKISHGIIKSKRVPDTGQYIARRDNYKSNACANKSYDEGSVIFRKAQDESGGIVRNYNGEAVSMSGNGNVEGYGIVEKGNNKSNGSSDRSIAGKKENVKLLNRLAFFVNNENRDVEKKGVIQKWGKGKLARGLTGTGELSTDKKDNKLKDVKIYIALKSLSFYPIPGFWVLRRDRAVKKLPMGRVSGINTIELPLEVRLLE